jgi:Bacterial Ig-like domain (group 4)
MNIFLVNLIASGRNNQSEDNVYPQDAPILVSPETITAADASAAGILFPIDLNGADDIYLSDAAGNWVDALSLNGISGVVGKPKRFVNLNSNVLLGTSSKAASSLSVIGTVNNTEYWGLNKNAPLKGSAGSGQSGVILNPVIGGAIHRMYNLSFEDVGYAGFLLTAPSSGGSFYKKTIGAHLKVKGLVTEGEAWYSGHVSTDTPSNLLVLVHVAGMNKGRNGFQHKWGLRTRCYNHTYRNVAQIADTAQNQAFQVEVCKDTILYDFIFDGVKYPFNLFTHDLIIDGGFTRYTDGPGYIGKASDFWPGHPNLNGLKVIFRNHTFIFDNVGTNAYLGQWAETGCNFEFQNCRFSDNHRSEILQDIRGGGSNSLIGTTTTNGNTVVPKATLLAEMPNYKSDDINSPDFCYLFPGTNWFNLGAGAGSVSRRTTEILDCKESITSVVPYGTAYGDLVLPSTVDCLLSTGKIVPVSVTWSAGSYDGNVAGNYTLTGTLSGYSNTDNVIAEKIITVEAFVNPNTVRINVSGTGGAYVNTGNWNHIRQSFSTGVQSITGDNSGQSLASLRIVGGTLTGFQVNIVTGFEGNDTRGMNIAGVYPANANRGCWENPGSNGTSRSFKITGLTNGVGYTFRILPSLDTIFNGNMDVTVSGSSGGGTAIDNYNANGNVNTVFEFSPVFPQSGEVTITVLKNSGVCPVNVIEFSWP